VEQKVIIRTLLLALIVLAASSSAHADEKPITNGGVGCKDKPYAEKLFGLLAKKDMEAFKGMMATGLATNQCVELIPGMLVSTDEFEFAGLQCIRPKGQSDCLWTLQWATAN